MARTSTLASFEMLAVVLLISTMIALDQGVGAAIMAGNNQKQHGNQEQKPFFHQHQHQPQQRQRRQAPLPVSGSGGGKEVGGLLQLKHHKHTDRMIRADQGPGADSSPGKRRLPRHAVNKGRNKRGTGAALKRQAKQVIMNGLLNGKVKKRVPAASDRSNEHQTGGQGGGARKKRQWQPPVQKNNAKKKTSLQKKMRSALGAVLQRHQHNKDKKHQAKRRKRRFLSGLLPVCTKGPTDGALFRRHRHGRSAGRVIKLGPGLSVCLRHNMQD